MGSSSTNATKRRPRSTNTGRTKSAEHATAGASDAERGMAAPSQKGGGARRKSAQARKSG